MHRRKQRTAPGYRRVWCPSCRRRFNTRTATPVNELQYPTDVVLLAVHWRLRYELSFRDVAELLLQRGYVVTYKSVRVWELRLAPLVAGQRGGDVAVASAPPFRSSGSDAACGHDENHHADDEQAH